MGKLSQILIILAAVSCKSRENPEIEEILKTPAPTPSEEAFSGCEGLALTIPSVVFDELKKMKTQINSQKGVLFSNFWKVDTSLATGYAVEPQNGQFGRNYVHKDSFIRHFSNDYNIVNNRIELYQSLLLERRKILADQLGIDSKEVTLFEGVGARDSPQHEKVIKKLYGENFVLKDSYAAMFNEKLASLNNHEINLRQAEIGQISVLIRDDVDRLQKQTNFFIEQAKLNSDIYNNLSTRDLVMQKHDKITKNRVKKITEGTETLDDMRKFYAGGSKRYKQVLKEFGDNELKFKISTLEREIERLQKIIDLTKLENSLESKELLKKFEFQIEMNKSMVINMKSKNKTLEQLQVESNKFEKLSKELQKTLDKKNLEIKTLNESGVKNLKEIELKKTEVSELTKQLNEAKNSSEQFKKQAVSLQTELDKARNSFNLEKQEFDKQLKNAQVDNEKLAKEIKNLKIIADSNPMLKGALIGGAVVTAIVGAAAIIYNSQSGTHLTAQDCR